MSGVSDANPTEERTTLTTGTDLQYSTSGLRTGAAGLREVVGQSEAARAALQGATPAPGVFGLTAAGAVYAAVLESVPHRARPGPGPGGPARRRPLRPFGRGGRDGRRADRADRAAARTGSAEMILTEEEVIAAARADPRELNALIAAGQPDAIIALSRAFEEPARPRTTPTSAEGSRTG